MISVIVNPTMNYVAVQGYDKNKAFEFYSMQEFKSNLMSGKLNLFTHTKVSIETEPIQLEEHKLNFLIKLEYSEEDLRALSNRMFEENENITAYDVIEEAVKQGVVSMKFV